MKVTPYFRLAVLMLTGLMLYSCTKKEKKWDSDAASSSASVDNLLKDVNKVVNQAASENSINGKTDGPSSTQSLCATVTLNPNDFITFPKTVTVNFGSIPCRDQYGVYRKGQFTAVFTGYLNHAGSQVTVTFQDYYVNGVKLEGTYILKNTTASNNPPYKFMDSVVNGKATATDGTFCTWNAMRTSEQTAGYSTAYDYTDDEYTIQGNSSGVGFGGKPFTAVASNVLYKLSCRYLVSGTVTIHSNNDPTPLVVDFGNGTCDNDYLVTYDIYRANLQFLY